MSTVIQRMPKVELHAHLGGSIDNETLLELYKMKYGPTSHDVNSELYKITSGSNISISDCFKKFKYVHDLTTNYAALKFATINVIKKFKEDNVIYLELRTTPRAVERMTKVEYMEAVIDGIENCHKEIPDITVKLLPSIDRAQGTKDIEKTVNVILSLAKKYPNIIKGIDFSGNPEMNSFSDFEEWLEIMRGNNLKLAIHCGEVENDKEIIEMLKFGIDRIGHGTFIHENLSEAWDIIREKNIPFECCLSSNVKCGTVKKFADHHFNKLYKKGIAAVICTDDCGVFDTTLTDELEICAKTFELSLRNLIEMQRLAITHSFADPQEKLLLRDIIDGYAATI